VVQALLRQGIGQGLNHMGLPHQFGEVFGAILSGQDKVRHGDILRRENHKSTAFKSALRNIQPAW
jgi:hypothetical protein